MKEPGHRPAKDRLEAALGRIVAAPEPQDESLASIRTLFDVKETENELTVLVDLPGVDEDEISIEAQGGALEIEAARPFDHDTEDAEEYTFLSRPYGTYSCSVDLPQGADEEQMTAKYRRGVLKVRIPIKKPNAHSR